MGVLHNLTRMTRLAAPLVAAIGCLQPGIDPIFLALLSRASAVPAEWHGLVVALTQGGAAAGALLTWRLGHALAPRGLALVALAAAGFSATTPFAPGALATLALRGGYGFGMGLVYAHTMASHAALRPNRAYASVFLIQLVLSCVVSALLPELDARLGAKAALASLALAPAIAAIALLLAPPSGPVDEPGGANPPVSREGVALCIATFCFIATTMLVWSYTAALATSVGLSERTIGHGVAIGAVIGAMTAVMVSGERAIAPSPLATLVWSAGLLAPLALTRPGEDGWFIVSIGLLNIGSTALIVRCSGLATMHGQGHRWRTLVAASHALGTIAGPLAGMGLVLTVQLDGLAYGAMACIGAGLAAMLIAGRGGDVSAVNLDSPGAAVHPQEC